MCWPFTDVYLEDPETTKKRMKKKKETEKVKAYDGSNWIYVQVSGLLSCQCYASVFRLALLRTQLVGLPRLPSRPFLATHPPLDSIRNRSHKSTNSAGPK
jgi:hypothetical protein